MNWLHELKPFIDLGATAVIALGLLAIVRTWQNSVMQTQERISTILENHLGEIAQHMAVTNVNLRQLTETGGQATQYMAVTSQSLALIQSKLLDAVIVPRSANVELKTQGDR